jgi:hypothetical protein
MQWYSSDAKDSAKLEDWKGEVEKDCHILRPLDTAWGVKIKAERVPLIAGGFADLASRRMHSKGRMMTSYDNEHESMFASIASDVQQSGKLEQLHTGEDGALGKYRCMSASSPSL